VRYPDDYVNQVIQGDCLEVMRGMPDNSVTALVTDPPYALEFMGKGWDKVLPPVETWREALRVCKPGAMAFIFGGTRTHHRLTCAVEDAGWEIRDCFMWLYGSGFPKSHDISKAIDKAAGVEREVVGVKRVGLGSNRGGDIYVHQLPEADKQLPETAPATDLARAWHGYGTAAKPSYEPVILAMKPLDGTFAQNAERHGVAGIHVDGGRIPGADTTTRHNSSSSYMTGQIGQVQPTQGDYFTGSTQGRWPANVALDEDVAAMLGKASRFFYTAKASRAERNAGLDGLPTKSASHDGRDATNETPHQRHSHVAMNFHPTVKPLALMRWLVRMVTMPSGTLILDPFAGSGTTALACQREGVAYIAIDREAEYCEIARKRLAQGELFSSEGA